MMQWQCLSLSTAATPLTAATLLSTKPTSAFNPSFSLQRQPQPLHSNFTNPISIPHHFNPLSLSVKQLGLMGKQRRGKSGVVCFSSSALLSPRNLHWVSAVSAGILMLVKGTSINKSFLVPFFALQAPASIISWMQGEYGAWSASLALLVRLFFSIPGELELPFLTLVLVIVAPVRAMNLRGTQGGTVISLAIAAFLAFQHFTRAGNLQNAFNQDSVVATLAIICVTVVPFLLLL